MDLTTLAVFRAVAREQGVTKAAELLGRVPSNVTTRLQQLEAELGVPLFLRDRKPVQLNSEGRIFLDYAERILNLADEARQMVNPDGGGGSLRLGAMEATAATRLPQALASFSSRWPSVTLHLTTGPTAQLVDDVLNNRIDCALIAAPSEAWWLTAGALDRSLVYQEELVLLLPPGHAQVTEPADITPRTLAAFASGCSYRQLAEAWLTAGATRKAAVAVQEIGSYHAMIACAAAGACFAVLPRRVLELAPNAADFTVKPLMSADTWLVSRAGFSTRAFERFRKVLGADPLSRLQLSADKATDR